MLYIAFVYVFFLKAIAIYHNPHNEILIVARFATANSAYEA